MLEFLNTNQVAFSIILSLLAMYISVNNNEKLKKKEIIEKRKCNCEKYIDYLNKLKIDNVHNFIMTNESPRMMLMDCDTMKRDINLYFSKRTCKSLSELLNLYDEKKDYEYIVYEIIRGAKEANFGKYEGWKEQYCESMRIQEFIVDIDLEYGVFDANFNGTVNKSINENLHEYNLLREQCNKKIDKLIECINIDVYGGRRE